MNTTSNEVNFESHRILTATLGEFLVTQRGKLWVADEPNVPTAPPPHLGSHEVLRPKDGISANR
ncbi:MAG: hypothetical protein SFV15_11655 [Polyangiaceae bacterium]|nr:hypothetical protein [Polyangiaceae bacterium]